MQAEGKMDKAKGTARNVAGDVKSFSGSPRTTRMGMRHRTYGGAGYRQSSPEHPPGNRIDEYAISIREKCHETRNCSFEPSILIIDKISGRVGYAVMSFGGFLGLGHSHYPIPWGALSYDKSLGGFRTNITEGQLRDAPEFSDDSWQDRDWETRTHRHYGAPEYWETRTGM